MTTLLIQRARCIALMDDANTELNDASLLMRDGRIERIIPADENIDELLKQVDEVIDARRHVVVPGLINTHHHMAARGDHLIHLLQQFIDVFFGGNDAFNAATF